jgi:hypothetical protein
VGREEKFIFRTFEKYMRSLREIGIDQKFLFQGLKAKGLDVVKSGL